MSNTNEKDDNLTVSRVYDTLKSPTFLKNLYWDILSDIKEKNTYKLMREIAEGVIDQNMEILDGEIGDSDADNVRRKAIVAEVSMMSYTIDKVFSKILFMKLEKACKEHIVRIIHELKDEGKIPENVWSKFKMNTVVPGSGTSTENKVVKEKPIVKEKTVQPKKEVQRFPTRVGKRRRKANLNYNAVQDIKLANSNKEILDDLKKVNSMKYTDENKDSANDKNETAQKKKSGGKVKETLNENMPSTDIDPFFKTFTKETDNQDVSDAESEISLGRMSESSISSVHTSDLSSFDDEISLSSDDENGQKKRVSLKEVLKRYSQSGPSNFSTPKKTDDKSPKTPQSKKKSNEKVKKQKNEMKLVSSNDTSSNALKESDFFETSNENGLSKRTRKPNSRYSDMYYPIVKVQERRKSIILPKANGQVASADHSPQKKKAKVDDDIYVDVVTITQSINEGGSKDNVKTPAKQPVPTNTQKTPAKQSVHTNTQKTPAKQPVHTNTQKTPAKQPVTPNLFETRSATRSLTSRKSAPLTLFST